MGDQLAIARSTFAERTLMGGAASCSMDAIGVRMFLDADLRTKLPASAALIDSLGSDDRGAVAGILAPVEGECDLRSTTFVGRLLAGGFTGSEVVTDEISIAIALSNVVEATFQLLETSSEFSVTYNRVEVQRLESPASIDTDKRPDACWYKSRALVVVGENKVASAGFDACVADFQRKITAISPGVPFYFGIAAAGRFAQFFHISEGFPGPTVVPVSERFDYLSVQGRVAVARRVVQVIRLVRYWDENSMLVGSVLRLGETITHGSSLLRLEKSFVKKTSQLPADRMDAVRAAYAAAENGGSLWLVSSLKPLCVRGDLLEAHCVPVGIQRAPRTESELVIALRTVLLALRHLHSAGVGHRDVRWPNIVWLRDGSWRLIDLEACCHLGAVPSDLVRPAMLPPELSADSSMPWTSAADCYQVGLLLRDMRSTIWASVEVPRAVVELEHGLMAAVVSGRLTVDSALASPWFLV